MAYFGGIVFANMVGGGGQNYFQLKLIENDRTSIEMKADENLWEKGLKLLKIGFRDFAWKVGPLRKKKTSQWVQKWV